MRYWKFKPSWNLEDLTALNINCYRKIKIMKKKIIDYYSSSGIVWNFIKIRNIKRTGMYKTLLK